MDGHYKEALFYNYYFFDIRTASYKHTSTSVIWGGEVMEGGGHYKEVLPYFASNLI